MKPMRAFRLVILLIVVLFVIAFASRNSLLQWVFKHEQVHFKATYHLNLDAAEIKFTSWNRIHLSGITVQSEGADTLLVVKEVEIKAAFLRLLLGKLAINEIKIDSATVTAYNLPEHSNLMFLKGDSTVTKGTGTGKTNYYLRTAGLKDKFQRALNTSFQIRALQINYRDTVFAEQINIPWIDYDGKKLSGLIVNQQLNDTITLGADVTGQNGIKLSFEHPGKALCYLPFLDAAHGFKCRFKSITADIKWSDNGDELQISPAIAAQNFQINHWRLAKEDVVFPQAQFTGIIKINENGFELDSSSTATLNHASFKVFTSYQTRQDTVFALNISMPETVSDTFFNALPGGMFNTLKGISCSGTLAYDLQFKINTSQPDSLIFESQLKRKNFHIIHMGEENYARINEPFVYDAFSGDQFIRHITVGPENPEFTPFNHINPRLWQAILQSEDPSFMQHRGFVAESFRESIAQNYKQHRFARGGSTISMQLVKNVFLSRNKTVSRKAEEALIVYLVENLGLVPKERMMEVYLNVIEWGPNVYGAAEAARFYFNKKPSELSLQECIFLAAIVPNPKYFRYQFDKQGEIKPYMADFFKIIEGRLVLRGFLNPADTVNFIPLVKLSGPALQMVVPADSAAPAMDEVVPDLE
jgi:hypothetical protein